jgi:predicted RNA-binding Zn-ribbon protein involved in translation (DUF1610 family)
MEQTLTVATYNEAAPGEALKDRLIEAGFHAELIDDSGAQSIFFLSREHKAQIKVNVRKEEYERAKSLAHQWESEGTLGPAIRCPQCGSSRIEYPQWSRRTGASFFFAILSAIHLVPREYFCEDCQFTWPDKVKLQPPRDALNWPRESKVP